MLLKLCRWIILLPIVFTSAVGQLTSVRAKVDSIVAIAKGIVGIAVIDLNKGDTLTMRGEERFPMQSVYKFPLALTVLDQVDKGTMALTQNIHITKADLHPDTWSPLRDTYPAKDIDLSLDSLLVYTVSHSDNNGCDILFRLLGGTAIVDQYVHKLGIMNMAIVATEEEMHQGWDVQYHNWSSPRAMAKLLQLFSKGNILSERSRNYLWRLMISSSTTPGRIKGLLPLGAVVAHKSGSSGTNDNGIAAATNDIGFIVFPDGRSVALVVFITESNASDEERDKVIASIARAVWDVYSIH
jgi:beta-lactamase class A